MSINALFSICQNNGNPFFDFARMTLIGDLKSDGFVETSGIGNYRESAIGYGVPGIFDSRVNNAAFSSYLVFIPLYYLNKKRNILSKIICIAIYAIFMYILFLTQQRSSFFLCTLASLFILYKTYFKNKKSLLYTITIVAILYFICLKSVNLNEDELGRFVEYSDNGRKDIFSLVLNSLSNNIIWGGPITINKLLFEKFEITGTHNYFLNAIVVGGLLGGIVYTILYFKIFKLSIRYLFNKAYNYNYNIVIFSIMVIVSLINSLVHNNGIIYGDFLLWLILGLLLIEINRTNIKHHKNNYNDKN
jgi:hypothetical protein